MTKPYTQETLIERMKELKPRPGADRVSVNQVVERSLDTPAVRLFGSVRAAMEAASIYVPYEPPERKPKPIPDFKPWKATEQEVATKLHELFQLLGREFTEDEFQQHTKIKASRAKGLLGRPWYKTLLAAGVPAKQFPKAKISAEVLVEDLKRVSLALGGAPSQNAYRALGKYCPATLKTRLGGWETALSLAGCTGMVLIAGESTPAAKQVRKNAKKRLVVRRRERLNELRGGALGPPPGSATQAAVTRLVANQLKLAFPDLVEKVEHSPAWLVNPLTKRLLRLDVHFPEVRLAVEYQSEYHFLLRGQKDPGDFEEALHRDYFKRQLLQAHNVILLEVAYFEPLTPEYISKKLKPLMNRLRENYNASQTRGTQKAA